MTQSASPVTSRTVIADELNFTEVGRWTLASCGTKLACAPQSKPRNEDPSTYIIASLEGEKAWVLYVGKSSDGWEVRRGRHVQDSERGFHHVILDELRAGREVAVFERPAGWASHDGFYASTNDAEEMALIARFNPRINKPADFDRANRFQKLAKAALRLPS